MPINDAPEKPKSRSIGLLRTVAIATMLAGAVVSLVVMFYKGRHNPSILLMLMFAIWVLSPFTGLFIAHRISKRWPDRTRATLYTLMLVITGGSLLGYSGVLSPPGTLNAFVFLVIPLASWVLIVTIIPISVWRSQQRG